MSVLHAGVLGERCAVDIRGRQVPVRLVQPPFVRRGKTLIDL